MSEELKEITRLCGVIKEKDKEIERLNNIIKEVREYIEPFYENAFDYTEFKEILEILTKGSEKE